MENVLVTGGAGFIGSVIVKELNNNNYNPIVYDNLVNGHRESIDCTFIEGDLRDKESTNNLFKKFKIENVIHCAGFIEGESMKNPYKFFDNNVIGGINLLESMVKNDAKKIIFSSSAGVYAPKDSPIVESDLKEPKNFYGETKLMFEKILKWYDNIHGIKSVSLRYFNAFGTFDGLGERHDPETHLIPLVLLTSLGKRDSIDIFGTDYNTLDGTCIRDYVHVHDIARAHMDAMKGLKENSKVYNLGTGKGNSVKEIIETVKKISDKNFNVNLRKRRLGDAPMLVADSTKIKNELGWFPKKNLEEELKITLDYFDKKI